MRFGVRVRALPCDRVAGAYNIVMGEPALYFGLVLLGTAFAIRAGDSLMPLALLAFFGALQTSS